MDIEGTFFLTQHKTKLFRNSLSLSNHCNNNFFTKKTKRQKRQRQKDRKRD